MLLKKKELNKELKNRSALLHYTSLTNYSSSKENKLPFLINNESAYLEELLHILECIIPLDNKFSLKGHKSKCLKVVTFQLSIGVISLDTENVDHDIILKHLLDESKVLGLHANNMDFAVDMLKTVKRLELKHQSFQYSLHRLEVLLGDLCKELKATPE
jgi:hypothetical protein